MRVKFWGVRGAIVSPGKQTARYGGNTPCVQVTTTGQTRIIVDAGIGIVLLGRHLAETGALTLGTEIHLLLTHIHWDHIQGLPFFIPIHIPGVRISVHACTDVAADLHDALRTLLLPAYSPLGGFENLQSELEFVPHDDEPFDIGDARITPIPLQHTVPTRGFHIDDGKGRVVAAFDHEGGANPSTSELIRVARAADLLIHDAQRTVDEAEHGEGWGHSSVDEAVRTARKAGVKALALFHHAPHRADDEVDRLVEHAKSICSRYPGPPLRIFAACEGLELDPWHIEGDPTC